MENCKFHNLSFRKCQFSNCNFKNYHDLSRGEFVGSSFRNCAFLKSNLVASDFQSCELVETKFKNNNLDLIIVRSVKLWKSNQCID